MSDETKLPCWNCGKTFPAEEDFCWNCRLQGFPTPLKFGRYRVVRALGEGTYGQVWLCRDPEVDRLVAVKKLKQELLEDVSSVAEMRQGGKLDHPNFVRILDANTLDSWIVLEYVDGGSLAEKIRDDPKWVRENFLHLAIEITAALVHAHALQLVHRDLKPANILLSGDGTPKIADFGLVRSLEVDGKARTYAGSPAYMAPEVLVEDEYDVGADMHSLGVMFYEMIDGHRPFERVENKFSSLVLTKERAEYPVLDTRTETEAYIARVIDKLLAPPDRRLASAENLLAQLRQADPESHPGNSIDDMQRKLAGIYGARPGNQSTVITLIRLNAAIQGLTGGLVHPDEDYGTRRAELYFPRAFSWICAVCSSLNVSLSRLLWLKYADGCPYCRSAICKCVLAKRGDDDERNRLLLEYVEERVAPNYITTPKSFQQYYNEFEAVYSHNDGEISEMSRHAFAEVAEAMDAMLRLPSLKILDEVIVLHLELADIIGWFFALLRHYTHRRPDYFFVREFESLYRNGCYNCSEIPCVCATAEPELRMSSWRMV